MKKLKIAQLIGVLILLVGVVIRVGGAMYGLPIAVLGLLIYAVSRLTLWITSDKR